VPVGARSMLQTGEWLIPKVGQEEFLRKPPLPFWLVAVSSYLVDAPEQSLPVSPMAARFPSAIAAILSVLVVYAIGQSMFGHRTGLVSGAVMASSAGTLFFAHNAQVEMVLTFFSTSAVACFWFATEQNKSGRTWSALFYLSLAMAMLAKAPLPMATVVLPLFVWWLLTVPLSRLAESGETPAETTDPPSRLAILKRQIHRFRKCRPIPGLFVFLLLFLPWPLYVYFTRSGMLDLWHLEFLDRYTGELSGLDHSYLYYIPIALGLVFPYSLSLPAALVSGFLRSHDHQRRGLRFAFTWVVVQFVFLSTSAFKRPHYLIGALPGMALLLGPTVDRFFFDAREVSRNRLWIGGIAILAILTVGLGLAWREVSRYVPEVLPTFGSSAALLVVGCIACFTMYALRKRTTSFVVLLATSVLTFAWSWDSVGQRGVLNQRMVDLMKELQTTTIGPADHLTWVAGRPDARIIYYMGLDVRPLFTALELAPQRDGRRTVPKEVINKAMEVIGERLKSDRKEYFIVKGQYWDLLSSGINALASVICRVPGEWNDPKDDWILFTNSWNRSWVKR